MRITVKVGPSTLAHATGRLNIQRMEGLCKVLSDLKNAGHEIILVSSGAIGMGVGKLSLPSKPSDMPTKQAAAAERTLILETKYGTKTYPLDELLHLYLAEGAQRTDILEHLKEETL